MNKARYRKLKRYKYQLTASYKLQIGIKGNIIDTPYIKMDVDGWLQLANGYAWDGFSGPTCKYPNCGVVDCYKDKGVDFCFQCDDFPCDKTNFDPHLEKRWRQMNTRMKEIGVEAYYEETKDLCRYL
jgi:hypothetical protein